MEQSMIGLALDTCDFNRPPPPKHREKRKEEKGKQRHCGWRREDDDAMEKAKVGRWAEWDR